MMRPEPTTPMPGGGPTRPFAPPALHAGVPAPTPAFLGREEISAEFIQLMRREAISVIALCGPPGIGKTALAASLAFSPKVLRKYEDGVLWAGLGLLGDARGALAAWANALGKDISHIPGLADRAQAVRRLIGDRRMLLVIDDAWDLDVARAMQCGSASCLHLLTTREENIARAFAGEQQYLALPGLSPESSLELLCSLAPEACESNPAQAQYLAGACRGVPLSLQLLGGFLATPDSNLTPQSGSPVGKLELAAERLGRRLRPRQEPSTAMLEILRLSLDTLPGDARTAFSELGAFAPEPDRFTREAAIHVAEVPPDTIDLLVARHLLVADREHLAMSQVLADVACESTSTRAAARHGDYYLQLARQWRGQPASILPIYGQIRYAWSAAPNDAHLLDWIDALSHYQEYSGQWSDYVDWAERGLQVAEELQLPHSRGVMYNNLAKIYGNLRQRERALSFYQQALAILEEVGTREEVALALSNLGTAFAGVGKNELALIYYQRALPLLEEMGDRSALATLLNNMGKLCSDTGQRQQALQYYQRALPILVELEDYSLESTARFNLALLYRAQGQLGQAVSEMRRAVILEGQAGHPDLESDSVLLAQLERELTTPRIIRWLRKLL